MRLVLPFTSSAESQSPTEIVRGAGTSLETAETLGLLDALSGLWCASFGYGDEGLVRAVSHSLQQCSFASGVGGVVGPGVVQFAEELQRKGPLAGSDTCVFLAPSGSAANDVLLRLVLRRREAEGRSRVAVLRGSFHGATAACSVLRGASPPGLATALERDLAEATTVLLPSPCFDREREEGESLTSFEDRFVGEVERTLSAMGEQIAAIWIEPVQAAGGVAPLTEAMAHGLAETARRHGIWIVADEVVTGVWRTGTLWGVERIGLAPDAFVFGKAISGGVFPLAGFVAPAELMDTFDELDRFPAGMTYGYHPAGAAAGLEVLHRASKTEFQKKAARSADLLAQMCTHLFEECDPVRSVRVVGNLAAAEFGEWQDGELANLETASALSRRVAKLAFENGVLLRAQRSSIALVPPLTADDEFYDKLTSRLLKALEDAQVAS